MHTVSRISSFLRVSPTATPLLSKEFFPLPFDKYITIYNEEIVPANHYDYLNDVIFDLSKILSENGIHIVQFLNSPKDRHLINCYHIDKFSFPQMNYLIGNSLLHVCTDTYTNEVSGALSVPSICLVGNRFPEISHPWYNSSEKNIVLGGPITPKPTFAAKETPKSINSIKTEEISGKILYLLNLKGLIDYETLFTGSQYHEKTVFDVIPDYPVNDPIFKNSDVCIRFDKLHDEKNCARFCSVNRFTAVVNKRLSAKFLSLCAKNCSGITFLVDSKSDPEDVRFMLNRGVAVNLVADSSKVDEKLLFKFLDFGPISPSTTEIDKKLRAELHNLPFRSSKIVCSLDKKYASYSHLEKGLELGIINRTINSKKFWQDSCRYKIYKEKT